jgi:Asp-tRNA(Asn)/Glu-tRNA(Gln) amidotransferase A subunit family amidase
MGHGGNGLPLAVQLVAATGRDDLVLRAARVIETAIYLTTLQ